MTPALLVDSLIHATAVISDIALLVLDEADRTRLFPSWEKKGTP